MAESRKVTIYINGKEVANSIKAITSESRKLRNELKNMTLGTDAYNKKMAEFKKADAILRNHNAQLRGTAGLWGKMKTEVKQFGMMAVAYLGAGQLLSGLDNIIQRSAKLSDTFADVRKTTELTADEVKDLSKDLNKIDTRSSREELLGLVKIAGKLGERGQDDLLAFAESADKINVALNEDLGGDIEGTIRKLGTLADLFGEKDKFGTAEALNKIGSAVNDLGAKSKAKESDIVDFTNSMGGIAPQANIGIQDILGLGAQISNLGIDANVASTVMSQVLPKMMLEPAKYAKIAGIEVDAFSKILNEDANEALLLFLEGLEKNNGGLKEVGTNLKTLGLQGKKSTTVLGALSNQTEMLRAQQALANQSYEDGISLITEFDIKNNTLGAVLEKLQKRIRGAFINPEVTEALKSMAFWVQENFDKLVVFGKTLGVAIGLYGGYKTMLFAVTKAEALLSAGRASLRAATIAYAFVQAKLTGNTRKAAVAQKLLNVTIKAGPWIAFAVLIAAVSLAFTILKSNYEKTIRVAKMLNKVQDEAAASIANEVSELDRLLVIAKDETQSKENRLKAIEQLNDISPEYLGNLTLENLATSEGTRMLDLYVKALNKTALAKAISDKRSELYKKLIETENSSIEENIKWYDYLTSSVTTLGSGHLALISATKKGANNKKTEIDLIQEEIAALDKLMGSKLKNGEIDLGNDNSNSPTPDADVLARRKKLAEELIRLKLKLNKDLEKLEIDRMIKDSDDSELELLISKWDKIKQEYVETYGETSDEIVRLEELKNAEINDLEIKRAEEKEKNRLKEEEKARELTKKSIDKLAELQQEALFLTLDAEERAIVESLQNEEDKNNKILEITKDRVIAQINIEEFNSKAAVKGLEGEKELIGQIEANSNAKRLAANEAFNKGVQDNNDKTTELEKESLTDIANATASFLGIIGGMMNQGTGEWKALKIAEATISMFTGMSTALEKGGIVGAIEAAGVFAMGTANITSILRTQIPEVPEQYYTGGYSTVRGGKDGRTYNAKRDLNKKGGYVDETSLVLGGERGPEYWVPDNMMNIPAVANITNAMEQLRTKKISVPDFENIVQTVTVNRQFVGGGYDGAMPKYSNQSSSNDGNIMREVLHYLKNPQPNAAIFDFDYYNKSTDLINKIQDDAAG